MSKLQIGDVVRVVDCRETREMVLVGLHGVVTSIKVNDLIAHPRAVYYVQVIDTVEYANKIFSKPFPFWDDELERIE